MPSRPAKPARRSKPNPAAFFSAKEVAAVGAAKKKASSRTPPEVLDAFAPLPVKVGELRLFPTSLGAVMVLERIGSPFADEATGPDTEITQTDLMALVFILTRPPEASLDLLAQGRPAFDRAVIALAGRFDITEAAELGRKIGQEILRAHATMIRPEKKTTTATPSIPPPATA